MDGRFYSPKDIYVFQTKRSITSLYKHFLSILEDIAHEHNYSQEKFSYLRKKVLDAGNEAVRDFEEQAKNFEISFGEK